MNDFVRDNEWQRRQRDKILLPLFYQYLFCGRFRFLDGDMSFQNRGIDTVIEGKDAVYVEEKIVRWKGKVLTAFALETASCTVSSHEKTGWMFYGEADRLLYCFQRADDSLNCWWLDFSALQKWFCPREDTFPLHIEPKGNKTACRIVPIGSVRKAVYCDNFQLGGQ